MRNLIRNQRPVWLCALSGRAAIADADGRDTGETALSYSQPVKVMAHVTAASGDASQEAFGIGVDYDKVAYLPGTGWGVDERTLAFVDKTPPGWAWDEESSTWAEAAGDFAGGGYDPTDPGADYAVVRVSETLNQTQLALRRLRDA